MSGTPSEAVDASVGFEKKRPDKDKDAKPGFFARIVLFVRQVVAELKKVNTPTRSELITYTTVVLVFVLVVMAFVTGIDFLIGKAVFWTFGN